MPRKRPRSAVAALELTLASTGTLQRPEDAVTLYGLRCMAMAVDQALAGQGAPSSLSRTAAALIATTHEHVAVPPEDALNDIDKFLALLAGPTEVRDQS